MSKIRIQIPFKKYGVIEVTTEVPAGKMDEAIKKAKELIVKHSDIGETQYAKKTYGNSYSSKGFTPSDKQLGLIGALKGDKTKTYNSVNEFNDYVTLLKNPSADTKVIKTVYEGGVAVRTEEVKAESKEDTPWELEI